MMNAGKLAEPPIQRKVGLNKNITFASDFKTI